MERETLKCLDPTVVIWPAMMVGEEGPVEVLTGADWNALVKRIEALEAAHRLDAAASNAVRRS